MAQFEVLAVSPKDAGAPQRFAKSLRETGYAVIKDHDIDKTQIEAMYDALSKFFASAQKCDCATTPDDPSAYFGCKSENAKGRTQKDLKEFFHVYQSGHVPPDCEAATCKYHANLISLGATLVGWLDRMTPLEVADKLSMTFTDMVDNSDDHLLRALHYQPYPVTLNPVRCGRPRMEIST